LKFFFLFLKVFLNFSFCSCSRVILRPFKGKLFKISNFEVFNNLFFFNKELLLIFRKICLFLERFLLEDVFHFRETKLFFLEKSFKGLLFDSSTLRMEENPFFGCFVNDFPSKGGLPLFSTCRMLRKPKFLTKENYRTFSFIVFVCCKATSRVLTISCRM